MSEPRLPDLTRSFERQLRAENRSDRTGAQRLVLHTGQRWVNVAQHRLRRGDAMRPAGWSRRAA